MRVLASILVVFSFLILGCSGGVNPLAPDDATSTKISNSHHALWGLWQFAADPEAGELGVAQLRTGNFHLNALRFLEPPSNVLLTVENISFFGSTVECDVGLTNPFFGLDRYTGFDVCGIVITDGTVSGFEDSDILMAGEGDTRLVNPDGYARWWNPAEFPNTVTIFGYKDGLQGTPDEIADYNCTINGYKYFCDDLHDPNDPLSDVVISNRGMFRAGQKNRRHYVVHLGPALVFNYAVDACWHHPEGDPPWTVPDDFPPSANRPEAWNISINEIENSLWNDGVGSGGSLRLSVDVYDWFGAGENMVYVESPGNFNASTVGVSPPISCGPCCSTYELDIFTAHPAPDSIDLLITVESDTVGYDGLLPDKPVCAYFTHTSYVALEDSGPYAYWPFDEGSGDFVEDISGNGYHGTQSNPDNWGTPEEAYLGNSCFEQTSGKNCVDFPGEPLNNLETVAIEVRVMFYQHGSNGFENSILTHGSGINQHDVSIFEYDGHIDAVLEYTSLTTGPGSINLNQWYHIRLELTGDQYILYLDDVPVDSKPQTEPLVFHSFIRVGNGAYGNSCYNQRPLIGRLDELIIGPPG